MTAIIDSIQDALNFDGCQGAQFCGKHSLGKIGTTGFVLGLVGGIHLGVLVAILGFTFHDAHSRSDTLNAVVSAVVKYMQRKQCFVLSI